MKTGSASPLAAVTSCIVVVLLLTPITGCPGPPQMRLSSQTAQSPGHTVWWQADDEHRSLPPIVAIEHCCASKTSQQIVFCDRGVRVFRYNNNRLVSAGPPLPGQGGDPDIGFLRAALRHYSMNPSAAREALPQLPGASISSVGSVTDVANLLSKHWSDLRVELPPQMTYRRIDAQLNYFPHGVAELYEASKAF